LASAVLITVPFTSEAIKTLELGNKTHFKNPPRYAQKDFDVARVAHNFYIVSLKQCHGAICFHIDKTISSP